MRVMKLVLACLVVVALSAATALAQEGYPLKGSWLGDYGPNKTTRTQVFLVMDWDGKAITGMINPGTDNMALTRATLEPNGWVVRLEAEGKDKDGSAVRYVIEGKIENLELPNRAINGTWSSNKGGGAFTASRQ